MTVTMTYDNDFYGIYNWVLNFPQVDFLIRGVCSKHDSCLKSMIELTNCHSIILKPSPPLLNFVSWGKYGMEIEGDAMIKE